MSALTVRTAVPSLCLCIVQSIHQLSYSAVVDTGSGPDKTAHSLVNHWKHSVAKLSDELIPPLSFPTELLCKR